MKTESSKESKASSMNPILKEILSWVEVFVVAIVLAWFIVSFIIVNATVPSGSMQDTIQPGDRLIGFRLTYLFTDPKRSDIVVFHYPVDDALGKHTNYIKRIIGLPGGNRKNYRRAGLHRRRIA